MALDIEHLTADAGRAMELQEDESNSKSKYSALNDIQEVIAKEYGSIVECCSDLIGEYTTWDYQCYKNSYERNNVTKAEMRETIVLLSAHIKDMMMFANDSWQMRASREAKLLEFKANKDRSLEETMMYGLFGTYRSYCKYFYNFAFRIGLRIQEYSFAHYEKYLDTDALENEVRSLCLYAALRNERKRISEEVK